MLTASPTGELVAGEPNESPHPLASYDVSSGTATVLASPRTDLSASYLEAFQITPDGADVITASGSPYYLQVFRISDLSQVGTYNTTGTGYPVAVSISNDGSVAFGTYSTNAIYIFAPGGTSPENTISFGSNSLANDGVALTPDGSELFAVTLEGGPSGTPQLNIIPNPLPISASGSPAVISVTVPATGTLTVSVASGSVSLAVSGSTATGQLPTVTITDTRNNFPGWSVSGQESSFTSTATPPTPVSGSQLGWTPTAVNSLPNGAILGAAVPPASPGLGTTAAMLALAHAGTGADPSGVTSDQVSATLTLDVPIDATAGAYTGQLTITYLSAQA
jgi:hypothetical protein